MLLWGTDEDMNTLVLLIALILFTPFLFPEVAVFAGIKLLQAMRNIKRWWKPYAQKYCSPDYWEKVKHEFEFDDKPLIDLKM